MLFPKKLRKKFHVSSTRVYIVGDAHGRLRRAIRSLKPTHKRSVYRQAGGSLFAI